MIGDRLRNLRMQWGLSQNELSRIMKVHPKAIKNWESDIVDPNIENICRLANFFHVSADYLAGRSDDTNIWIGMLNANDKQKLTAMIQAYLNASERDILLK